MSKTKQLFEQEREKISLNEINKNTKELLYMCAQNFKGIFQEVSTICKDNSKTKKQTHNGRN
jgi:hypothetical protein